VTDVAAAFGSGWTRPEPAMLLVEPLTTVWPVAPGTLGSVAAEELFMFGLLGFTDVP